LRLKDQILFLLACLGFSSVFGQNYGTIEFVENKGQWNNSVRFMAKAPAGSVFLQTDGFTILQHNAADLEALSDQVHGHTEKEKLLGKQTSDKLTLRSHAYKVQFVNAAANPQIIADKPLYTYNNYFIGNDPSKWAANCKIYQGITVKNIYPNIDVRYYSNNGQMKYDLIVHPGANPADIALKFDGVDKLEVKNKELVIGTSVGELKELNPYTYQYNNAGKKEISNRFVIKDKVVRFDVKNYDPKSTLVIDPTLIFCSFAGSTAENWGFTATYGPDGSMYGGGIVDARSGAFPVSTGAFQTTYGGGEWDIGIIKLSPDGTSRVYATYIGGSGIEQPHSLVVNEQGEVIIAGRSNSGNFPTTGPTIGTGGGYDIIVTKLNASGTALVGSRKMGGSADDGVNITANRSGANSLQRNYGDDGRSEVIIDGGGNIYVASSSQSSNFPITGGFQTKYGGGAQDGVVLKFPPNLSSVSFASFLGGSANDAAYVLSLNPSNSTIYVSGGTESVDFPGPKGGTISASNHGSIDGFVAVISNDGSTLQRATYVGTGGIDQVFGVQFDKFNFPYIMGQTTGSWPVQNATWSQGGGKQFIAKLQPDLSSYVYSTTFGTSNSSVPNISPIAFLVDRCENVYVSGWGGTFGSTGPQYPSAGVAGMSTTPDAIKPTLPPSDIVNGLGQDFYFFVLKRDATAQLYGSFFGQNGGAPDHVDGGTSRFDRNGVIYQAMCANCKSFGNVPFPTTPGVWSPNNPSPSCNLAMVKIAFNLAGVHSAIQSQINGILRDTAGCVPLKVDFIDSIQNAVTYEWTYGDGSPMVVTTKPTSSHTFTAIGTYRVMLVAVDSSTCNIRDTSFINIKVGDVQAQLAFNPVKLNPCDSFKYRFDNTSFAPPSQPFTAQSFVWDFGDGSPRVTAGTGSVFHTYAAAGSYVAKLILVDKAYCNYPDTLANTIRIASLVKAGIETPKSGCLPYTAQFKNVSDAGQRFIWDFGDGATSTAVNPLHTYTSAGTFTVTLVAIDSATCNFIDSTKTTIGVYGIPTADFSASPQPPIVNTPITFTNLASPDAVRFKWLFGDGDSLLTNSRNPVQHEFNQTTTYTTCQIAYNQNGCADTICKTVTALVEAAVDVPSAFTPLSGDVNSIVYVRGYGIAKMKFIIWNRWGQKVFETDTRKAGWDGKYKGVLQPMDVYAYTLEVEFSDGTKTSKKGDITLIR
jgi:gliding motility-associated-like protein